MLSPTPPRGQGVPGSLPRRATPVLLEASPTSLSQEGPAWRGRRLGGRSGRCTEPGPSKFHGPRPGLHPQRPVSRTREACPGGHPHFCHPSC